ncbi:hypothetical protein CFP65_4207 [Kitasatospora sp. MMS16-BH015]|uniref:FAD binding domain-containing protein n=1 Tax=Kitasatospora sp. MMS16-BH015 TaxID=2018025 RepID=UPI000CA0EDAA|nr:FAD binding domain-containing protein [Kitasatospora sp. MMS16-BH015]AUG78961.1 hypothetical protein CFP65_4207 [Kitasatospora sp. MMS16-BH015]
MKPAPFVYVRPDTVEEAVAFLAEHQGEARALAGGQSLIPLLHRRLVRPTAVVDLARLDGLRHLTPTDGGLRIGALTRHAEIERGTDPALRAGFRTLPETARLIGHQPVRTRGTFGGTLAHGDPSAEWCLLAVLLDAELTALGPAGSRTIAAESFFTGAFRTALRPDELLVEAHLPYAAPTAALVEYAPQRHQLPLVAAAAAVTLTGCGRIATAQIALAGVADRPVRARAAEQALIGGIPEDRLLEHAGLLATRDLEPADDARASGGYRRELAAVLLARAVRVSLARCAEAAREAQALQEAEIAKEAAREAAREAQVLAEATATLRTEVGVA